MLTWSSTLRSAPFTSGPLLYDLDGDTYNDIIAANVAGEVWGIHGESGHVIDGWPFFLESKSFHSTPLLVCVSVCCVVCVSVCVFLTGHYLILYSMILIMMGYLRSPW